MNVIRSAIVVYISVFKVYKFHCISIVRLDIYYHYYSQSFFLLQKADPCASFPCEQGGTCTKLSDSTFSCSCVPGYNPATNCATGMALHTLAKLALWTYLKSNRHKKPLTSKCMLIYSFLFLTVLINTLKNEKNIWKRKSKILNKNEP